ncbi:MAG: hypothetical protein J7J92_00910 [Candidatus Aenigmarchaeota archaeon]|nr:hypothetical protein [Candidatus Aenigmarchaeota archaeon]
MNYVKKQIDKLKTKFESVSEAYNKLERKFASKLFDMIFGNVIKSVKIEVTTTLLTMQAYKQAGKITEKKAVEIYTTMRNYVEKVYELEETVEKK